MVKYFFRIILTHRLKDNANRHLILNTLNIFLLIVRAPEESSEIIVTNN